MDNETGSYLVELGRLLLTHCPNEGLVTKVYPRIGPLLVRPLQGVYPLKPAEALNKDEVAQVIMRALHVGGVTDIRFVSAKEPNPLAGLGAEESTTLIDVYDALHAQHLHALEGWFGKGHMFGPDCVDYFRKLGYPIVGSFIRTHKEVFTSETDINYPTIERHIRVMNTPSLALFFLLGHLFAGHEQEVEELLPFVELLTDAIPICEPFAEADTWVVLVQ